MKTRFGIAATIVLAFGAPGIAYAAASEAVKTDEANINTACAADAKTTGCSSEVVGKGLLKCMGKYKEANKTFKHSPECEAALKQLHADSKGGASAGATAAAPATPATK